MKCPYRDFSECVVEQCPACNYEMIKTTVVDGRRPSFMMPDEEAIKKGYCWKETKTDYKFLSCNLINNNVQPIPSKKEIINDSTTTKTTIVINKSIF